MKIVTIKELGTRDECPEKFQRLKRLIRQCLSRLLVGSNNFSSLEAKPVDGTDYKEDDQREFKERYIVHKRNVGQTWECHTQYRIGIDIAQSPKPEEVDDHQSAIDQR